MRRHVALLPRGACSADQMTVAQRRNAVRLLNLTNAVDAMDVQLLPSVFRALEYSMSLTPSSLAALALSQALASSLASPVWGRLADTGRYSRKQLLVSACVGWGVVTTLIGASTSFNQLLVLRALNGLALGALAPLSQSVLADLVPSEGRGAAFGVLQGVGSLGKLCGGFLATIVSQKVIWGVEGWRFAFFGVGAASLALGAAVSATMRLPSQPASGAAPKSSLAVVLSFLRVRTFVVIVAQGLFGAVPWSALAFLTMWLQYVGFSNVQSSLLMSSWLAGTIFGGPLGGMLGDWAERRSRDYGRTAVAQFSVAGGIPFVWLTLRLAPRGATPWHFCMFFSLLFSLGLISSWCAGACNRPILVELVDPSARATVFGMQIALEGSSAALLGAPVVGYLSERVFGYVHNSARDVQVRRRRNQTNNNTRASVKRYPRAILSTPGTSGYYISYNRVLRVVLQNPLRWGIF